MVPYTCRFCGSTKEQKLIHFEDKYCFEGQTSSILSLLERVTVLIKCENGDLLPQFTCITCFNKALEVKTFLDSAEAVQNWLLEQTNVVHSIYEKASSHKVIVKPDDGGNQVLHQEIALVGETGGSIIAREDHASEKAPQYCSASKGPKIKVRQELDYFVQESIKQNVSCSNNIIRSSSTTPVKMEAFNSEERKFTGGSIKSGIKKNEQESRDESISAKDYLQNTQKPSGNSAWGLKAEVKALTYKQNVKEVKLQCNPLDYKVTHKQNTTYLSQTSISYKCSVCDKAFSKGHYLKKHMACHSDARPFRCLQCPLRFKHRRNLMDHSTLHNSTSTFICSICGKTFKQKNTMLKHEKSHQDLGDKYMCKVCNKKFTQSSHLKSHIRKVHNGEEVTCVLCNSNIKYESSLTRHLATVHNQGNKFTCPYCNKGFSTERSFEGHVRIHTGDRPFPCMVCNKTFTTQKALTRHKQIHNGIKSHKCIYCNKAFLESSDLKKHVRKHNKKCGKSRNVESRKMKLEKTSPVTVPPMDTVNVMVISDPILMNESSAILSENQECKGSHIVIPVNNFESTTQRCLAPDIVDNSCTVIAEEQVVNTDNQNTVVASSTPISSHNAENQLSHPNVLDHLSVMTSVHPDSSPSSSTCQVNPSDFSQTETPTLRQRSSEVIEQTSAVPLHQNSSVVQTSHVDNIGTIEPPVLVLSSSSSIDLLPPTGQGVMGHPHGTQVNPGHVQEEDIAISYTNLQPAQTQ